jgi:acetate---CoA ligase (ADP-forming)
MAGPRIIDRSAALPNANGLKHLLQPRSIAVIGASEDRRRIGGRLVANLIDRFPGPLYPVNPHRDMVQGLPASASVDDLPEVPDLALVAVPAEGVLDVAARCAERGVGGLVILSSGFAETDSHGEQQQRRLKDIAFASGMRIVGPNCVGMIDLARGLLGTYATVRVAEAGGGLGILSQSGALGVTLWNECHRIGVGAKFLLTTGNEVDVTVCEALTHLVERQDITAILLFLEAVNEPQQLYDAAAHALRLGKPIVAMKTGVTERGAQAAKSHTGSLAAPDAVVSALLERAGIVRVSSPTELVFTGAAMAAGRFPCGDNLGVITISGGTGVIITDAAAGHRLALPAPSPRHRQRIRELIPSFGSASNPIDVTGNFVNDPSKYAELVGSVVGDIAFDAVCVAETSPASVDIMAAAIQASFTGSAKPVVAYSAEPDIVRLLNGKGVPTFNDAVMMVQAVAHLRHYARRRSEPAAPPPFLCSQGQAAGRREVLNAAVTAQLMDAYGVPRVAERCVVGIAGAVTAANEIGYPVAVKVDPTVAAHKAEIGGLRLGLASADEVESAVRELATLPTVAASWSEAYVPVVVQAMVRAGIELVIGASRHPLGVAVLVGMGGPLVHIVDESVLGLVPLSEPAAGALIDRLCGGRLVSDPRGLNEAQRREAARVVVAVSQLLEGNPEVAELDINPLIATNDGLVAVDALVVATRGDSTGAPW